MTDDYVKGAPGAPHAVHAAHVESNGRLVLSFENMSLASAGLGNAEWLGIERAGSELQCVAANLPCNHVASHTHFLGLSVQEIVLGVDRQDAAGVAEALRAAADAIDAWARS